MAENYRAGQKPSIACEITSTLVAAARVSPHGDAIEIVHSRSLPAGAVTPSLTGTNVVNREAVREAVAETIGAVGGRTRDVIAVIPDATVKITLLDFDTLPEKTADAEPVVRFRLKKSLPFDVEKAAVSYDAKHAQEGLRVVTATMLQSIRDEYESVIREAGYLPGIMMPSTLAALGAMDGNRPTMLLKLDAETTSVAIVNHDELLLFRTLEGGTAGQISAERLAEDVYPSLVYFQDTYGENVELVLVSGVANVSEVAEALQQQTGSRIDDLLRTANLTAAGMRPEVAGAIGALL